MDGYEPLGFEALGDFAGAVIGVVGGIIKGCAGVVAGWCFLRLSCLPCMMLKIMIDDGLYTRMS